MIALGIDPDVSDLAIAAWCEGGPLHAQVIHVVRRASGSQSQIKMANALADTDPDEYLSRLWVGNIAIEGQQIDGRRARPKDLFTLAHVTGMAAAWCIEWFGMANILIPTPAEWKGAVAKHAMQARLYTDLEWGYALRGSGLKRYAVPLHAPTSFDDITPGQWKHVGDALLLARWAHQQH